MPKANSGDKQKSTPKKNQVQKMPGEEGRQKVSPSEKAVTQRPTRSMPRGK